MEETQSQFPILEPTNLMPALDQLASQGGAWALVVILLGVVAYLFRHIVRENAAQRAEDRKTIDRLANVIASNTAGFQVLSEIVRSRKDRQE